ncbi:MAG: bacillithiol biosynthesis deacetylase BshB1 [Candidatus Kapaibacterium sp.]
MVEVFGKYAGECDLLCIYAHPDDAELSSGGTIVKLTRSGGSVVLIDCTRGEMGTRGTPEIRLEESAKAAGILGVKHRINMEMPDCNIKSNDENILEIIKIIRRFRPRAIMTHPGFERHTDHEAVNRLVREANFKAGLAKIPTAWDGEPHERFRTRRIYFSMQSYQFTEYPAFYVDISEAFEQMREAIEAYESQIFIPGKSKEEGLSTRLYNLHFLEQKKSRSTYFGSLIGVRFAEAFQSIEPIGLENISSLLW